jgi:hypothetical protein
MLNDALVFTMVQSAPKLTVFESGWTPNGTLVEVEKSTPVTGDTSNAPPNLKYPEFALIVAEGPTDPFVADCCLTLEVKLVASHAWPLTVKNCKFPVVNLRPHLSSSG